MLRHVHGTLLLDQGHDLGAVADRLGHSSTRLTQDLYRHTLQARAVQLAYAMGDILDVSVTGAATF